jgi:hypothetical protein
MRAKERTMVTRTTIAPGTRSFRSLRLGWTDPDSGEELLVEVDAPESFLDGIEEHGFVVLGGDEPAAPEGWGRRVSVVAVARADMGRSGHGDPRR